MVAAADKTNILASRMPNAYRMTVHGTTMVFFAGMPLGGHDQLSIAGYDQQSTLSRCILCDSSHPFTDYTDAGCQIEAASNSALRDFTEHECFLYQIERCASP